MSCSDDGDTITCGECPDGFAYGDAGACVAEVCDEASMVACGTALGGDCEMLDGIALCSVCPTGFDMADDRTSCTDHDECEDGADVCSGGTCVNTDGAYRCESCPDGARVSEDGLSCESDGSCPPGSDGYDACMLESGGFCAADADGYRCTSCPDGYALGGDSQSCADIDECAAGGAGALACMVADGGTCTNTEGDFSCGSCPAGFALFPSGRGCEVPPTCGDGIRSGSEVCDDGNRTGGDGCRADCTGTEICGDGLVDTQAGEQCDDGNDDDEDGCDVICQLPPAVTTPPVEVNVLDGATLSCTLTNSNTGRKVAVDQLGRLYAVLNCGGSAVVTSSVDGGFNWRAPFDTGLDGVFEVAIQGAGGGVAYVAAITSGGLEFVETRDSGETWSTPLVLGPASDAEVSIDSYEEDVFIAVSAGSNMAIYRSVGAGSTSFNQTLIAQDNAFHEVIVDPATGNVLVATDTPSFHLRLSEDHGLTYGAEVNPIGTAYYSDWTLSNGRVFVSGTMESPGNIDVIPLSDISMSSVIGDLPSMGSYAQSRSIDSNALGDVFVVSNLDDGTIQLDRLPTGTTSFPASGVRTLPTGRSPAVAALPSNDGAVVLYDDGTHIWATVQAY